MKHPKIGDVVWFIEEETKSVPALVRFVHDYGKPSDYPDPLINLVIVSQHSGDESDGYGAAIINYTSVCHASRAMGCSSWWEYYGEDLTA